jgi:hypothetical protein
MSNEAGEFFPLSLSLLLIGEGKKQQIQQKSMLTAASK